MMRTSFDESFGSRKAKTSVMSPSGRPSTTGASRWSAACNRATVQHAAAARLIARQNVPIRERDVRIQVLLLVPEGGGQRRISCPGENPAGGTIESGDCPRLVIRNR